MTTGEIASPSQHPDGPPGADCPRWIVMLHRPCCRRVCGLLGQRLSDPAAGWWDGPKTKRIAANQLRDAAVTRPERWMWVYNAPSAGTRLCKTGAAEHGDSDLAEWIDRWHPEMVICGHISTRRHGLTVGVGSIDADGPGCSSRVRRPHRFIGQACITQLVTST